MLGDDEYLDAVVKGSRWLARVRHESGGIPDFHSNGLVKKLVTDATAQAVHIWLILYKYKLTGSEYWLNCAEKGLKFLHNVMFRKGPAYGALLAHVYALGPVRYAVPRVHTRSIMFVVQAFTMYEYLEKLTLDEMIV